MQLMCRGVMRFEPGRRLGSDVQVVSFLRMLQRGDLGAQAWGDATANLQVAVALRWIKCYQRLWLTERISALERIRGS